MLTFHIHDMTCGHCASVINKALKAIDTEAKVTIDLENHLVSVVSAESTIDDVRDAIAEAGYTPKHVDAE